MKKQLHEIITPGILDIPASSTVDEALKKMADERVSCLVILEDEKAVGIFTERDIVSSIAAKGLNFYDFTIEELMTKPVVTINGDTFIFQVLDYFQNKKIRHLVMLDSDGNAAGVVTQSDILKHLGYEYYTKVTSASQVMVCDPITIPPGTSLLDASKRMANQSISFILVGSDGQPDGIITERDITHLIAVHQDVSSLSVEMVMTRPVITIKETTSAHKASELMQKKKIRRLVVTDKNNRTVGIITQTDLIQGLESSYIETLKQLVEDQSLELNRVVRELTDKTLYLDSIINSSGDIGIVTTDGNLNIAYCNAAAQRILDHHSTKVIGHDIHELFQGEDFNWEPFEDILAELKTKGNVKRSFTVNRNGEQRFCHIRMSEIFSENTTAGLVFILEDITEQKRVEERNRELSERLMRAQKMEAMGLMAGGVAHDLNNILSGVVTYPEMLLYSLAEDDPMREQIEIIRNAGLRAAAIVGDLLTVSRSAASSKEVANLNPLAEKFLCSPEYQELLSNYPEVLIDSKLDRNLMNITCSPIHLHKALMNLVINGIEAIQGAGRVTIATSNCYLDRPLSGYANIQIGEYAVLSVSDNGSGISSQDMNRIFEPFYTKKVMGRSGTGLGLAIVWNMVHNHNGYINVVSDSHGTVFDLYFPINRGEIVPDKKEIALQDIAGHREKILVIDDEQSQRQISSEILRKLGYSVEVAGSGEEAASYLLDNSMDLLVLDMIMDPGMNGLQTYEEIIKIHPGQKAIIVSGYAETKDVEKAQELGVGCFLRKPYTFTQLGLAVMAELK